MERKGWWNPDLLGRSTRAKFHYTLDGKVSLCRKWWARFVPDEAFDNTMHSHPDNCATCSRKLKELQAKETPVTP